MRWLACVGSVAAVACTATNPAYEGPSEPVEAASESTDTGRSTSTLGDTLGDTLGGTLGDTPDDPLQDTSASDSGGGSSGSEIPLPAEYCQADLYAVNDLGELYLLDADTGDATLLITDVRLESWAIATDPSTGILYVSELAQPGVVWRVQPFPLAIDDEPLTVPAQALEGMARATFDPDGNLWLGTDDSHRFVWLSPSGKSMGDQTVEPFPWGGDMVFLEPDCAMVPTLDGSMYRVCFAGPGDTLSPAIVTGLPSGAQFTGIAVDAMDRVWLSTTDANHRLVRIEQDTTDWTTVQTVAYAMAINDLALVIEPSGC
jgi:hypothetical protein